MAGQAYNGIPANVPAFSGIGIAGAIADNPTVIATTAPHGLRYGDVVDVFGHTGNTAANCIGKSVTIVDSTHFSIPVNSSSGYTTDTNVTGLVWPRAFTGNNTLLPANSDPYNASTYIPAAACEADRTAYLLGTAGVYRLVNGFISGVALESITTSPWAFVNQALGAYGDVVTTSGGTTAFGSLLQGIGTPAAAATDTMDVSLECNWEWTGSAGTGINQTINTEFALYYAFYIPGFGGSITWTQVPYSVASEFSLQLPTGYIQGGGKISLGGAVTLGAPQGNAGHDTVGIFDLRLFAYENGAPGGTAVQALARDASVKLKQWRANTGLSIE
jgi:hypothetical protein